MTPCFIKKSKNLYEINNETGQLILKVACKKLKRVQRYNQDCQNVICASSPFNLMPDHILDQIVSYLQYSDDFKICVPYFNYKITSHPLCQNCGKCENHICKCKILKYCQLCRDFINGHSVYYRIGKPYCKSCGWKENILISKRKVFKNFYLPDTELVKLPSITIRCRSGLVTLYERKLIEKVFIQYKKIRKELKNQHKNMN